MSIGAALVDQMFAALESAYLSLHFSEPDAAGSGEISGNRYQRMPSPGYERINAESMRNSRDVLFEGLPRSEIVAVGFWDAPHGGNFLCSSAVERRDPRTGDSYRIRAGDITIYQMQAA